MADFGLAEGVPRPQVALRYRVEGMDCPSCASKIETAVTRLGGAADVRVNYKRQVLALRLDEAATPRSTLEENIRKLGYGVAPMEAPVVAAGEPAPEPVAHAAPAWWQGTKARLAAIVGALIVVGFVGSSCRPTRGTGPTCPPPWSDLRSSAGRRSPPRVPDRRSRSRC